MSSVRGAGRASTRPAAAPIAPVVAGDWSSRVLFATAPLLMSVLTDEDSPSALTALVACGAVATALVCGRKPTI
jgi:hypothetical protein